MDKDERISLGKRLKQARTYLELSQEEVASMIGVSRSAISLAESGNRGIDSLELQRLSKIYHKSVSELLGEVTEEPPIVGHLARAATGLTENDQKELLEFARFLKSRAKED